MAKRENTAAWHKKIQGASICSKMETQHFCVKYSAHLLSLIREKEDVSKVKLFKETQFF